MNIITDEQRGYIAGIIDGEGCIGISRKRDRKGMRRGYAYRPCLTVSNTKQELLTWLKEVTGVGTVCRHKPARERCRPSWRWQVWSVQAAAVLQAVLPCLVIKKDQARIALDFVAHTKTTRVGRRGLTDEEHQRQVGFYEAMAILNKRGVFHG